MKQRLAQQDSQARLGVELARVALKLEAELHDSELALHNCASLVMARQGWDSVAAVR